MITKEQALNLIANMRGVKEFHEKFYSVLGDGCPIDEAVGEIFEIRVRDRLNLPDEVQDDIGDYVYSDNFPKATIKIEGDDGEIIYVDINNEEEFYDKYLSHLGNLL